jgi:hypothetical protein
MLGIGIGLDKSQKKVTSTAAIFFTDEFGMPSVAYSLRKLSPGSTNCVRVRRSSDNVEQDFGFIANVANSLIDSTALLAFVGANDGFITTWYDQSTNLRNSVQVSATAQPKIVSAGAMININTKPSLLFDGVNDVLKTVGSVTDVGIFSIQLLEKLNSTAPTTLSMNVSDAVGKQIYMNYLPTLNTYTNYYAGQSNSSAANTNQVLSTAYMGSGGGQYYRNNVLVFSPTQATGAGVTDIYIGSYIAGLNVNANFQEVIIWDANKTSTRSTLEANINNFYNVF